MSFGLRMHCIISYLRRKILIRSSGYIPPQACQAARHACADTGLFLSFFLQQWYIGNFICRELFSFSFPSPSEFDGSADVPAAPD